MAALKTQRNADDVLEFLESVSHPKRREDGLAVLALMKTITGLKPEMWGNSIVGFGSYHYRYDSGREGDWFITGFSPRKQSLTLYIMAGFDRYDELMANLGKYKKGRSCLYINKLEDVNLAVLSDLIQASVDYMNQKYNRET